MFLELIKGVALLLALCFLHGVNIRLWRQKPLVGQIVSGVLFGGICVVGMLMPLVLMPGVIFDARSVVLSMAGLFGGPLVAIIAGTLTMAWRLWLGGAGMGVGLLVVVICVSLGLLYRYARQRGKLGDDVGLVLGHFSDTIGMRIHQAGLFFLEQRQHVRHQLPLVLQGGGWGDDGHGRLPVARMEEVAHGL